MCVYRKVCVCVCVGVYVVWCACVGGGVGCVCVCVCGAGGWWLWVGWVGGVCVHVCVWVVVCVWRSPPMYLCVSVTQVAGHIPYVGESVTQFSNQFVNIFSFVIIRSLRSSFFETNFVKNVKIASFISYVIT